MKQTEMGSIRDTIQSIWVAIILAFVLRAFMLEAFEIPTGSMAPRLMGLHALLTCPDCRYQFPRGLPDPTRGRRLPGDNEAWCPNCGESMGIPSRTSKSGDRVLVLKIPRVLRSLERWDVVVFKDVQSNRDNYIKRLVGLPGEVVRIIQGDVYVHRIEDRNADGVRDEHDLGLSSDHLTELTDWRIARKSHRTQAAMWQLLFDNDFQPANVNRRVPWQPLWEQADPGDAAWQLDLNAGRVFGYKGATPSDLRFAHRRIKVFMPTNSYNSAEENLSARRPGIPCSDLKLETTLLPTADNGSMRLTLSSRRHEFAGEVHFDGRIRLLHRSLDVQGRPEGGWDQADEWLTEQLPRFESGRPVSLALTHVDWRVTLWVDGAPVLVTTDQRYRPDIPALLADGADRDPLTPQVGIAGLGGEFELWHTRVFRDVFYTCPRLSGAAGDYLAKHFRPKEQSSDDERRRVSRSDDDRMRWTGHPGWGTQDNPIALRKFANRGDYDEFFMLGDNSPSSSDSRLWVRVSPTLRLLDELGCPQYRPGTVPRYNLIGKAFFVYWPSGTRLPEPIHLPLVPDVGKMRRIN